MASPVDIGRYLAEVRERAGLKQIDLARKVTLSPAVLSRIESGERAVSEDELNDLLKAINTPESKSLRRTLERKWNLTPEPPLGHADQDLLWSAEVVSGELQALRDRPEVKHAFGRRIAEYLDELQRGSEKVRNQDYQVAFIGSIGVGKSTAICRLTGLEVPGDEGRPATPILEAGGGGVTVCEVHLRQGPDYGLLIEPRSDDEIRRDVSDFAEFFVKPTAASDAGDPETTDADAAGLSKEIARAVRNMADLRKRKEKSADGKTTWSDEAENLAKSFTDPNAFAVEILSRMQLARRVRRDLWYSPSSGKSPLQWLQEMFQLINNGRHPEFSLPKRIEVVVREPVLAVDGLSIRLVDTKGIDQTAERADLESHFDSPHTLSVLCSMFNGAPTTDIQLLLNRAKSVGVRNLHLRSALLVLPRPDEALAVKDDAEGIAARSVEEGYELKRDQIEMQLQRRGLEALPVGFFNSREDERSTFRDFLAGRIAVLRSFHRDWLMEVIANARNLIANHEKEQAQTVMRAAARRLGIWVQNNLEVGRVDESVHDSLLGALASAYASTIRATVNRSGNWPYLDYEHHLGFGARRVAAIASNSKFESFKAIAANLLQDDEFVDARELVEQSIRVLESAIDELLLKVQLMGRSLHVEMLKVDQAFWQGCVSEWGTGRGYRDRVTERNRRWFGDEAHSRIEGAVRDLLTTEWRIAVERVGALCQV